MPPRDEWNREEDSDVVAVDEVDGFDWDEEDESFDPSDEDDILRNWT